MNLLRAAATVSSLTLLSRITGLVRDLILARVFGGGAAMDAFAAAFRLPNLLRRLFAEGAFSQAFVPILAEVRNWRGEEATRTLASHVMSGLFWVVLVISILGVLFAPVLVYVIASGFAKSPATFELATLMTRWMFPYIFFMALVAFSAGVLNTYNRFAIPAVTPVLLNLSMIGFGLLAERYFEPPGLALGIAVFVGGVLQLALQVPALARIGMLPRVSGIRTAFADADVRRILGKMGPAVFAVSVAQLSLVINTNIASHLGEGANAWLYYADRLMEFPTALLGVALATVLVPSLSKAFSEARHADYSRMLDWGLRLTCLIALPAAVGLGLLAEGLIAVLFQGGRFGPRDVAQTALALTGYAVGLFGLIAVKILAPGFYAQQDIKTPVKIAVGVLIATQLANLALVPWLKHAGLAWSISLGALANAALLYIGLRRRGTYVPQPGWARFIAKIAVALALLAVLRGFANERIDWIGLHSAWLIRAGLLAAVLAAAMAVYFGTLLLLGFRPRDFLLRSK
ncbi:MAG: murein biosynthesis integral membrane protein MurJ [Betaproteobacteria bacterium]